MKKKCRISKYRAVIMTIMIVVLISLNDLFCLSSEASTYAGNTAYLVIDHYEVSNEKVVPGDDFTFTLYIKNTATYTAINDVLIDLVYPAGIAPVYGNVAQKYISSIAAGEIVEVSFDFESQDSLADGYVDFMAYVTYNGTSNTVQMRIPSGNDSPFNVVSASMKDEAYVGENIPLSVAVKVIGDENVSGVSFVVYVDDEIATESSIGILSAKATKTQNMSIDFDTAGTHIVTMMLEYEDKDGKMQDIEIASGTVFVKEQVKPAVMESEDINSGNMNIALMGISAAMIVMIFLVIVIVMKKGK